MIRNRGKKVHHVFENYGEEMVKLYDIIYADPPWPYERGFYTIFKDGGNSDVATKYNLMSEEDILGLSIPAKPNSILFLWATVTRLEMALKVLRAWGFRYRTHGVWYKKRGIEPGSGLYFRIDHEILLVGVKGKELRIKDNKYPCSVFHQGKNRHSQKPQYFRNLINDWYPDKSKIELFARRSSTGFDVWGDESNQPHYRTLDEFFTIPIQ
jgi:N6-adenosine-specific RNA methylase IME4